MPSATFFNLPAEKREKLLKAAREEFARVPFPEASVNKIVQAAEIPRGSFYQYFIDKEDLFHYLIGSFTEHLLSMLEALLEWRDGDIFAAFLDMFDTIGADSRDKDSKPLYEHLIQIVNRNQDLGHTLFMTREDRRAISDRLCAKVDGNRLDLRGDKDLEDMVFLLAGVAGPALVGGILTDNLEYVRETYKNMLNILSRGMAKKS